MGQFTSSNVGSKASLGEVEAQAKEFRSLVDAIDDLSDSLRNLASQSEGPARRLESILNRVKNAASGMGSAIGGAFGSAGRVAASPGSTSKGNYASQRASASSNMTTWSPGSPPTSGDGGGGSGVGAWLGGAASGMAGFANTVAMTPLRFGRDIFNVNRNTVLGASSILGLQQSATGATQEQMLGLLARNIGGVRGSTADILQLLSASPQFGAMVSWLDSPDSGFIGGAPRAPGFFGGIRQAQQLNPGASMQSLIGTIGGQAASTQSQQASMMLTGGAYSMVGRGGRQRTLSEWADSVYEWLKKMRPGGGDFTRSELISQYFPGSNIDAWFNVNGISPQMREYWWAYILGKKGGSFTVEEQNIVFPEQQAGGQRNNLAALRLRTANATTQGQFALGASMSGAYGNREQANRAFMEMFQSVLMQTLPGLMTSGPLQMLQFMPDMVEDILFGLLERAPSALQTALGGGLIAGSIFDIGDEPRGMYGEHGGTSTAGLHPSLQKKIGMMQRANPRIRITSGLRDEGLQQRLKKKGYANVSGRSSAHTRGLAADLGPASEYGWIAANAGKFGLNSGKSHGEPWHVGIGDEMSGPYLDLFKSMFGGFGSDNAATAFGGMGSILGFLMGALGQGSPQGPAFDMNVYKDIRKSLEDTGIGLPTVTIGKDFGQRPLQDGFGGFGGFGGGGGGGSSGPLGFRGGSAPGPWSGSNPIAAAKALRSVGFSGDSLATALAIAGRESNWESDAHRTDKPEHLLSGDRGLMQINYVHDPMLFQQGIIQNKRDLFDPRVNAQAAWILSKSGTDWSPWGFTGSTWGSLANPLNGTDLEEARRYMAQAGVGDATLSPQSEPLFPKSEPMSTTPVMAQAGVGDVIPFPQSEPMSPVSTTPVLVFNNSFQVDARSGGGINVNRAAAQMADALEGQMKRRLVRSS